MGGTPTDADDLSLAVADEVLKTIASEHRLFVLIVLGDACTAGEYGTLRFSDIREATAFDDSGRLNYHLQQLVDTDYVASVEEGYRLTLRGLKAYQAVKAGFYAKELAVEPFELETSHDVCGAPLYASYRDQRVRIECQACGDRLHEYPLPPGPFDETAVPEIAHAMDVRFTMDLCSMSQGFCPYCSGPTDLVVGHEHFEELDVEAWDAPAVLFWCTHCHWFMKSTPERPLLFEPVVLSFFADRGVSVLETPGWSDTFEAEETVLSEEPLEIELAFTCGSDTLAVVVDGSLEVLRSEVRGG